MSPRLGVLLEATEQDFARVLFVVGLLVGDEENGKIARQVRQLLGDNVEMLGGVEGKRYAAQRGEIARPHSAGDDHLIGADFALIGDRADSAAAFDEDAFNADVLKDRRSGLARALRHRDRHVDRIDLPVFRRPKAADEAVGVQWRPALLEFFRPQDLNWEAEISGH